jgi:hypothetical protein
VSLRVLCVCVQLAWIWRYEFVFKLWTARGEGDAEIGADGEESGAHPSRRADTVELRTALSTPGARPISPAQEESRRGGGYMLRRVVES